MSAFILGRAHINFLVQAARVLGRRYATEIRWHWGDPSHSSSLARYDRRRAEHVGQMLWNENIKSVACRYGETDPAKLPGPVEESFEFKLGPLPGGAGKVDPVMVLKACDCYEYQSCEHPGWEDSQARGFIRALRARAIHSLPGYDTAPAWEVTDAQAAAR